MAANPLGDLEFLRESEPAAPVEGLLGERKFEGQMRLDDARGPRVRAYGGARIVINHRYQAKLYANFSNGMHFGGGDFKAVFRMYRKGALFQTEVLSQHFGPAGFHGAVERNVASIARPRKANFMRVDDVKVDFIIKNPVDPASYASIPIWLDVR